MENLIHKQAGISTLLTSIVFLFIMGVAALATNRASLTEQQMGNNEYRSMQAQQNAQAGLDLVIAQISEATIATSSIANRANGTNFDVSTSTVSGTALLTLSEGSNGLNYRVFAVRDTSNPAQAYLYITSTGLSDCDSAGANCQSNAQINSRIQYTQTAGSGRTPATLSVNGNIQACGNGQSGNQCSSVNAYMNTFAGTPKYTTDAVTYGGQINGVDSTKDANGRDVIDGNNTTVYGSDAQGPNVDKTAAKDVGTLNSDKYFEQFFGDTKGAIKNGSTTTQITPAQLKNFNIPARGGADAQGVKPKPPIIWVTGDVNTSDFGAAWNSANKEVIVIVEGNITVTSANHGTTVGFLYATGNVNAGTPNVLAGPWDFYGALAVEGSLNVNSSFALRPQRDPNDLLGSFPFPSTLALSNGNWSDF